MGRNKTEPIEYYCKYCGKEMKRKYNIIRHETTCKKKPNDYRRLFEMACEELVKRKECNHATVMLGHECSGWKGSCSQCWQDYFKKELEGE